MTTDFWSSSVGVVVIIFGIIIGSIAFLAVVYVWVKKQIFGVGGLALCAFGTILLGLSVWKTIDLTIDAHEGKLTLRAAKELAESNNKAIESAKQAADAATASANVAVGAAAASQNPDIKHRAMKAANDAAAATAAVGKAIEASRAFNRILNAADKL